MTAISPELPEVEILPQNEVMREANTSSMAEPQAIDPNGFLAESGTVQSTAPVTASQGESTSATASNAGFTGYDAETREVKDEELASNQLSNFLSKDSPAMQRAKQQGYLTADSRGLLNTTYAGEAAMGAMVDRAEPFVLSGADAYRQAASENLGYLNEAKEFTAGAENTAELTNAQLETEVANQNAQRETETSLTNAQLSTDADISSAEIQSRENIAQADLDTRINITNSDLSINAAMTNLQSETQRFLQGMQNMSNEEIAQWNNQTQMAINEANVQNRTLLQQMADDAASQRNMDSIASSQLIASEANATQKAIQDLINANRLQTTEMQNENALKLQQMSDEAEAIQAEANRQTQELIAQNNNVTQKEVAELDNASREGIARIEAENQQAIAKYNGSAGVIQSTLIASGQIIANTDNPSTAQAKISMNNNYASQQLKFLAAYNIDGNAALEPATQESTIPGTDLGGNIGVPQSNNPWDTPNVNTRVDLSTGYLTDYLNKSRGPNADMANPNYGGGYLNSTPRLVSAAR